MIKARLYGGAAIIIGVDAGRPEDELDLEKVGQDSLKFLHVVSKQQIRAGRSSGTFPRSISASPNTTRRATSRPQGLRADVEEAAKPSEEFARRRCGCIPRAW